MNILTIPAKAKNYAFGRGGKKIEYIVIHYTANNGDTAVNNGNYFANNAVEASAHYFVDETDTVVNAVAEENTAYHCGAPSYIHKGCRNNNSIGIEICSRRDANGHYYFIDKAVRNAAELTRRLMAKYGIGLDHVLRHYDVTGKICPAPFVDDIGKWKQFRAMLVGDPFDKLHVLGKMEKVEYWRQRAAEDENIKWLIEKAAK